MTTVKMLENQLKVSKVSIYSMLKRNEIREHVFKGANNITFINDIGVEMLKAHYLKAKGEILNDMADEEIDHSQETCKAESKASSKDDHEVKNLEIIRILQGQLEEKDEQINHLLNIVLNQQKLQATQLLADNQQDIAKDTPSEKLSIKNFFGRIFNKKPHRIS